MTNYGSSVTVEWKKAGQGDFETRRGKLIISHDVLSKDYSAAIILFFFVSSKLLLTDN